MREHVKCLHHVGIPTRDMDATIRFYTDLGAEIYFQKMDQEAGEPIRVVIFDFYGIKVEAYERRVTAGQPGAIDHIAFQVTGIEELYRKVRESGYTLMKDCAGNVQPTTYWPQDIRWFIVIGPNGEKVEFSEIK